MTDYYNTNHERNLVRIQAESREIEGDPQQLRSRKGSPRKGSRTSRGEGNERGWRRKPSSAAVYSEADREFSPPSRRLSVDEPAPPPRKHRGRRGSRRRGEASSSRSPPALA
jgi:hypothetical protein